MHLIEKRIAELEKYAYPLTRTPDFDRFWAELLEKTVRHDPAAELRAVESGFPGVRIFDGRLRGLDGTLIHLWLLLPEEASAARPVPGAMILHGGGGSRGDKAAWADWARAGFAVLVTEFRDQGGETKSATPMKPCAGTSFFTFNLDGSPENSYFYHALGDQQIVLDFFRKRLEVDGSRVAVCGMSQGGGASLILAGLNPELALCCAGVPSYTCWELRIWTQTARAADIALYLRKNPAEGDRVFRLVSYFDALNFADRIRCRVEFQCCLDDECVPAECVYAAYNRVTAPKNLTVYPFGRHSDGDRELWLRNLESYLR